MQAITVINKTKLIAGIVNGQWMYRVKTMLDVHRIPRFDAVFYSGNLQSATASLQIAASPLPLPQIALCMINMLENDSAEDSRNLTGFADTTATDIVNLVMRRMQESGYNSGLIVAGDTMAPQIARLLAKLGQYNTDIAELNGLAAFCFGERRLELVANQEVAT